ncbi:MAG: polyphosphate kinase 2 [Burkholderiales bacterium]|nr:polyphosphate kinase 2 [Burkholderiales bacterium]
MAKTDKQSKHHAAKRGKAGKQVAAVKDKSDKLNKAGKLKREYYENELAKLHGELVALQDWVKKTGAKVMVVFEGRDAAGKGGAIKAITERVSPRVFRVEALPAPTEREKTQMFMQRYITRFPAGGEVVIFDRSWYNQALVNRVMGFTEQKHVERFLELVPLVESFIVEAGIILIKFWLEVDMDEQTRRFQERITDPRKTWKLSPMDLEAHRRWYDYSRARDAVFKATDSDHAPWHVLRSNDKRRARLNCIAQLLSLIPYKKAPMPKVDLPKRQKPEGYKEPDYKYRWVKERY